MIDINDLKQYIAQTEDGDLALIENLLLIEKDRRKKAKVNHHYQEIMKAITMAIDNGYVVQFEDNYNTAVRTDSVGFDCTIL